MRKIHLFTGLVAAAFLFMYFLSGFVMINPVWPITPPPQKNVRTESLTPGGAVPPEQMGPALAERFGIRGKALPPRQLPNGTWRFSWGRPGRSFEVLLSPAGDSATYTETIGSMRNVLVGMHRLHGYGGGALYDLWSFMYDFSCVALILFAFSGLWLWLKKRERSVFGWLCFGTGMSSTAALVLYYLFVR